MQYDVVNSSFIRIHVTVENTVTNQTEDQPTELVYDSVTKVIYYSTNPLNYNYRHMTNYISENGKFCRYINGKIVEID